MVSTSSPSAMLRDWYGRVKKKSNASVETTAAMAPTQRPPAAAATTTSTTKTSATLAWVISSRSGTSAPATTIGPSAAIVSPIAAPVSPCTFCFMIPGYARRDRGGRALTGS